MGNLGLQIAASGLQAQQAAMETISQNLSNANTPGYVSESATLTTALGSNLLGIGGGVRVAGIEQAGTTLLTANANQAAGAQAQSTALQTVLQGAQSSFPISTSTGLANDLSTFWQSWDQISQNPSALAPRTAVVDQAQTVVTDLQQASAQLTQLQGNAEMQLQSTISSANTQLTEVAQLNVSIANTEGAGAPAPALIDQRNQLVSQLASSIGASTRTSTDGSLSLSVGGVQLVSGNVASQLNVTGSIGSLSVVTANGGINVPLSSGTSAGLMAAVNQYLPSYQSQLNGVASALATTVNTQLAAGYTATGASGSTEPLFQGSTAAGITVNAAVAANPQLLAASSTSALPAATNDAGNAQALAELSNSATGPDQAFQTFIQNLGSQVQSVNSQVASQASVASAAQQNLQAVAGVNTDSQMVQMLTYQQAYQASAKLITAVDTMMQSLIQAT